MLRIRLGVALLCCLPWMIRSITVNNREFRDAGAYTSGCAQGLFLSLCSGTTPTRLRDNMGGQESNLGLPQAREAPYLCPMDSAQKVGNLLRRSVAWPHMCSVSQLILWRLSMEAAGTKREGGYPAYYPWVGLVMLAIEQPCLERRSRDEKEIQELWHGLANIKKKFLKKFLFDSYKTGSTFWIP